MAHLCAFVENLVRIRVAEIFIYLFIYSEVFISILTYLLRGAESFLRS